MSESYIKVARKLLDWEWYNDSKMVHLFIHLLLKANFKPGNWRGHKVMRGQLITGTYKLSQQTTISPQSIRSCLKKLKSTNEITINSTNQFSLITLVNYEKYQTEVKTTNKLTNKPVTNEQQTGNKRLTTIEEEEERKEGKNEKVSAPQNEGTVLGEIVEPVKAKEEKKEIIPPAKKKERTDLHHRIISIYSEFMISLNEVKPKITGQDGEGAKRIIAYLKQIVKGEKTDDDVCDAFEFILSRWSTLDQYTQKQVKLIQIDSNLNSIVTQIKKPTLNGKQPVNNFSDQDIIDAVKRQSATDIH